MSNTKQLHRQTSSPELFAPDMKRELAEIRAMSSATYKPRGALFSTDWSDREHRALADKRGKRLWVGGRD